MSWSNLKSFNAGLYCWAGPGTKRMINLKYPHQKVDHQSLESSYDLTNLASAQDNFQISDAWVTYSWGFNSHTEQPDYQFLRGKLNNFKQLGIRTHAYVQGMNRVESEFEADLWCRDHFGRPISYHRGRYQTCPNNPKFQSELYASVGRAVQEDVDGVFIDNLAWGLLPVVVDDQVSFFGCACNYCRQSWERHSGDKWPFSNGWTPKNQLKPYLDWRSRVLVSLLEPLVELAHQDNKIIGANCFDPKYNSQLYYGFSLEQLDNILDYILLENHSLAQAEGNSYLKPIIADLKKPVVVVSYRRGIGRESLFSQAEFDHLQAEAEKYGFTPVFKASEFTQNDTWLNLDFNQIKLGNQIQATPPSRGSTSSILKRFKPIIKHRLVGGYINRFYPLLMRWYYQYSWARRLGERIYYRIITN